MDHRTLVVVPTYNELPNVEPLVGDVLRLDLPIDLLVVDDGSPDGTADAVESRFGGDRRCRVLRRAGPRSFAQSILDGYRRALADGYAAAIQMDADFSHAPLYLPDMLDAGGRADVVIGSRYVAGGETTRDWPRRRLILSEAANAYMRALTRVPVRDVTSGFRLYTRRALERIGIDDVLSTGFCFQTEMTLRAHRAGLTLLERPIVFSNRRLGESKLTAAMVVESLLLPWRLRARMPRGTPASPPRRDAGD